VAIADIISRIADDARAEADGIIASAKRRAAEREAEVRAQATREAKRLADLADEQARVEAGTLLANARLSARDRLLSAKRERAEAVLESVRERIESLPDGEYAQLIARRVAASALPGQIVRVAPADRDRLATLGSLLGAAGVDVRVDDEPAEAARGVVLEGGGVRVDVSPASLIATRRDELLHLAAEALFGNKEV
jgi:vacuolar-type H+-ATPase subunit E/Vma4